MMNYSMSNSRWFSNVNSSELVLYAGEAWFQPKGNGFSPVGHSIIGVYLTVLGLAAALGNGTVLVVMNLKQVFRRKSQNQLITALAWSDLLLSVFAYPMTAVSSFYQSWIFGDYLCRLYGFLCFMLSMASMNTLVIVAIFRYIIICHPSGEKYLTPSTVKKCVLACWTHAFIWTSLPLLGWNSYTYEAYGTSCSINWMGESFSDRSYVVATMATCYVFQISTIIFCYVNIVKVARSITFGWKRKIVRDASVYQIDEVLRTRKIKAERAVTLICFMMIVAYFVAWTPYAVISVASMAVVIPRWLTTLPTMFAKLACAANPVLYVMLSRRFRGVLRRLRLTTQRRRRSHPAPNKEKLAIQNQLYQMPARDFVTKEGIYIGKNRALFVAEPSLF